jgi:hypothetical protein
MKWPPWFLLLFLGVLTFGRLWLAAVEPLTAGEAYRFLIAVKWDWASFDGPGGLAALIHWFAQWMGASPLSLRLPGPLFVLLGSLALYHLAVVWSSPKSACWVVLAWNLLPAFNSVTSFSHPAIVGAAFLPVVIALVWSSMEEDSVLLWGLAGFALAWACFVSYWNLLAWMATIWAGIFAPGRRSPARMAGAFLACLIGLIGIAGPLVWNVRTGWLAFSTNTWQTLLSPAGVGSLLRSLQEAGQSLSLLLSAILVLVLLSIVRRGKTRKERFAAAFAGFFALAAAAVIYHGEQAGALVVSSAVPLLIVGTSKILDSGKSYLGDLPRPVAVGAAFIALFLASFHSAVQVGFQRVAIDEPDWAGLSERLERALVIHQPAGEEPLFLIASEPSSAAALSFWMVTKPSAPVGFPPVFLRESQNVANQFGLWHRYDEFVDSPIVVDQFFQEQQGINPYMGRSALYLGEEPPSQLPQSIRDGFEEVVPLERITILSSDGGASDLYLYFCQKYVTAPL